MKILSYNILSGGFASYHEDGTVPQRLDWLREAVKEVDAEVVSLIDTYRWSEVMNEEKLKALFGYPYVFSVELEDDRSKFRGVENGITVLTKHEAVFRKIRLFSRNAIRITVKVNGVETEIFAIYLDDTSEYVRMKQIEALFKYIKSEVSTIIIGDLNTIDKDDISKPESDLVHLMATIPSLKAMGAAVKEMERGEVTAEIKKHNFVDADEYKKRKTIPSKLFVVPTFGPILRLDYAFYNKFVHKVSFEVLRAARFETLSDHYPILLEIE